MGVLFGATFGVLASLGALITLHLTLWLVITAMIMFNRGTPSGAQRGLAADPLWVNLAHAAQTVAFGVALVVNDADVRLGAVVISAIAAVLLVVHAVVAKTGPDKLERQTDDTREDGLPPS